MNIQRLCYIAAMGMTIVAIICIAYSMFSTNVVLYFAFGVICAGVSMVLFGFHPLQAPNGDQS